MIMSSQYEIVKMKESESSLCNTDCDSIRITITDKTAHKPEMGTTSIRSGTITDNFWGVWGRWSFLKDLFQRAPM